MIDGAPRRRRRRPRFVPRDEQPHLVEGHATQLALQAAGLPAEIVRYQASVASGLAALR